MITSQEYIDFRDYMLGHLKLVQDEKNADKRITLLTEMIEMIFRYLQQKDWDLLEEYLQKEKNE